MGFDRATARGQVKAQELMTGYFNCYYNGLRRLSVLQASKASATRTSPRSSSDYRTSAYPRLRSSFAWIAPEKDRVLRGFPSLLPA
jgi:hypothetical protein